MKASGPSECCKDVCVPLGLDLILPHFTFQDFTKTFNRCLPDDNVSKFYSVFSILQILLFQWSGIERKKKIMGPKKWVTYINLSHALD